MPLKSADTHCASGWQLFVANESIGPEIGDSISKLVVTGFEYAGRSTIKGAFQRMPRSVSIDAHAGNHLDLAEIEHRYDSGHEHGRRDEDLAR